MSRSGAAAAVLRVVSFVNEGLGRPSFMIDLGGGAALGIGPARRSTGE